MADDVTKSVLFSIKLDTGDIIVKQAALAGEIAKGTKALKDLKSATGEGTVEYQKQKAELQNLQREYKSANNILQTNQRIAASQKGSYEELLNTTKKLEIELKLMGQAGDTTSKEFLDLTAQVGKNKEALNVFNQGINVGTSNVGRYGESLVDVKAELKSMQTALLGLQPGTKEFDELAKKAGALKDKISDAKDATKAFATESKTQTAKTLFGQIGNDLKDLDFQGAADKAKTFATVVKSISFGEIIGGIKNFGSALLSVGKAFLANPFGLAAAGVVVLTLALDKLADKFGLFGRMSEAQLKNNEALISSNEQLKNSYSKLGDIYSDEIRRRRALGENTAKLEDDLIERQIASVKAQIQNLDELTGLTEEQFKERADLLDKQASLESNLESQRLERSNKEKEDAKQKKKEDDEKSKSDADKLKADNKKEAEEKKKQADALLELNSKYNQDLAKQREDAEQARFKQEEADWIAEQARIKANQEISAEQRQANFDKTLKENRIRRLTSLEAELIDLQTAGESTISKQIELEEKRFQVAIANAELTSEEELKIRAEHNAKIADLHNQEIEEDLRVQQAKLEIATQIVSSLRSLSELFAASAEDNAEFLKALAVFQISIDTAKAISSAVAAAASTSITPIDLAVKIAASIATVLGNIAQAKKLLSASPPKAEKGIILGGQPHSNGGTMISADGVPIAEAEKGELLTIVNKRSTGMLKGLSNLNQLGGGIPFMKGGGIPEFQSGGVALANDSFSQNNSLSNMLKNMPRPVVIVQDIVEATERLSSVEDRANV